jgi:hypothetical protein
MNFDAQLPPGLCRWLEARWDGVVAVLEAGERLVEVR